MTDLSKLCARVIDNGLSVSVAERLARKPDGFGRVEYFCPFVSGFPTPNLAKIGTGFDGVERIYQFWDDVDSVDVFIFLDVHFGDLQEYLRRKGKLVWGSGEGEDLELFRHDCKQMMKIVGLPVVPSELITGLDALREYLKENENVWVKISEMRGITETFKSDNYNLIKGRLDGLQHDLGPLSDSQCFIVEQEIETEVEVGYDGYCIDGAFPKMAVAGIEVKDTAYVGAAFPYEQLGDGVKSVNQKLAPILKQYGYRGLISTEIRVDKKKTPFLVDVSARYPSPPGEILQEMIKNLPLVIYEGAKGNLVEPDILAKCAVGLMLYSDAAAKQFLAVEYPKPIAHNVKLYNSLRRNGIDYVVPTAAELEQVGAVTGFGDTFKEAAENALDNAKQVKGDRINVKDDVVDKLMESLRESKAKGINFGTSNEIPD